MIDRALVTLEEYVERKQDPSDESQWIELASGKLVILSAPNEAHGTALLNFSKVLAETLQSQKASYACFELGLVLSRDPDTVRCPAVSVFEGGERFAESGKTVTEAKPSLVVEIASSPDRRENVAERIDAYFRWGIEHVWVIDPVELSVALHDRENPSRIFTEHEHVQGHPVLPSFQMPVSQMFAAPSWWSA